MELAFQRILTEIYHIVSKKVRNLHAEALTTVMFTADRPLVPATITPRSARIHAHRCSRSDYTGRRSFWSQFLWAWCISRSRRCS